MLKKQSFKPKKLFSKLGLKIDLFFKVIDQFDMSAIASQKNKKRKLSKKEINNIVDFIRPNPHIPKDTALVIVEKAKESLRSQLEGKEIYPEMIEKLSERIRQMYLSTIIESGESVGVITAQSIGEKQTQSNLNTFHKAGSSDKQPVVSKFSELLNATNKPKAPSYWIYFKYGNASVPDLRQTIGHSLVQLTLKKIVKNWTICIGKEPESWYNVFYILYGEKDDHFTDCISVDINMDILFEFKLSLGQIAEVINCEYTDSFCVFSPDCFGKIDIYFDTRNIDLPEEKLIFVTQDNAPEIYLEEVVQPILENVSLCGISGITNMFFVQDNKEWIVEAEIDSLKYKNKGGGKEKTTDATKRFKKVLAHPAVDMTQTISNNVWDIYYTLGVEATRQYMIDEFSKIMEGINICHVMLLVDKMTFLGTISSISRYTMRREESGPFGKASFEETLDNFLKAGVFGQEEPTRGVSASIICGKIAPIGTGMCDLAMDIRKLSAVKEESEAEDEDE
jgi:DNA-directed RNA polymerase beta' subunit